MSGERKVRQAAKPASEVEAPTPTEDQTPVTTPAPTSQVGSETLNSVDVFPDFATSPEEVTRRTRMLQEYVRDHMNEGEDYGIIPGGNKPTLFKPGAEKLNAVFGLSPMVEVTSRLEDWDSGFVAYEVKVALLNKRSGSIEAEGIGSCNSRERRYKNQDAAGIANTVLKMAKKRALVDATLSATRASGMFTQDLEDIDFEPERSYSPRSNQRQASQAQPERDDNRGAAAAPRESSSGNGTDVLTDAQHRAILAIAGRVFGRHSREEDLNRLVDKPLEQLTKFEASALIDRLRGMLGESPTQASGEREVAFTRATRNGSTR
jgi:hypothetical protein